MLPLAETPGGLRDLPNKNSRDQPERDDIKDDSRQQPRLRRVEGSCSLAQEQPADLDQVVQRTSCKLHSYTVYTTHLNEEKAMSDPRKKRLPTRFWKPAIVIPTL